MGKKYIDADELNKAKFHPLPYTHITPTDTDAESYKRGWNDAIDAIISEAPAADVEPVRRWIPCSERLPEEDYETGNGTQYSADVLATVVNHANDDECYVWLLKTVDGKWYDHILNKDRPTDFPYWCEVIAWMPLPSPYKEGEE